MRKNSFLKLAAVLFGILLILWFAKELFVPYGYGMNMRFGHGGGSMYMGSGFGITIAMLLTYLIKFLFVVFIIGLVGGLVVLVKNNIFTEEDIESFKAPFKGTRTDAAKVQCAECGKEVNGEWKVCPYCGTNLEK